MAHPRAFDLLVLFDLDGTLLIDDAYVHGRAMVRALRVVYEVDLPEDAVERIQPWGKTDPRIAREILLDAGVADEKINDHLGAWMAAAADAFSSEAAESASVWKIRPGLRRALTQLRQAGLRLTLVTGNLRAIAAVKVELMSVAQQLDLSAGGYGDDAEERALLLQVARTRAGSERHPWPCKRTVVIGDTPGDIAAAVSDGVRCVVFESERFPKTQLRGAGAVISNVTDLVRTLTALQRSPARRVNPRA
jgi:phosphoglycolate phosphatase-like HAD superfamily hydrolase